MSLGLNESGYPLILHLHLTFVELGMTTLKLGKVEIEVDDEIAPHDLTTLKMAFAELKDAYSSVPDEQLARAVFLNWIPGIEKDAIVAASAEQLGSHG